MALHNRVTALEAELRIASQCMEALATELREIKSQERKAEVRPHEESDVFTNSHSTKAQPLRYETVAARIERHVLAKAESFYPSQIARELGVPGSYVGRVLSSLCSN